MPGIVTGIATPLTFATPLSANLRACVACGYRVGHHYEALLRLSRAGHAQAAGNPVAATVAALHLERNAATLLLRNELDLESDSDDDAQPPAPTRVCYPARTLFSPLHPPFPCARTLPELQSMERDSIASLATGINVPKVQRGHLVTG